MTIYFANCLGSCLGSSIDLPDDTRISAVIEACTRKWSYGSLKRMRRGNGFGELIWCHDEDANWINCCAEKIERLRHPH